MRLAIETPVRVCIPTIAALSVLFAAAQAALAAPDADGSSGVADICRSVLGLSPGMEHFDRCTTSLTRSLDGRRIPGGEVAPAAGSWFRASFQERRSRVDRACGRLSLEPGSRAYRGCVARLNAAMFAADHAPP